MDKDFEYEDFREFMRYISTAGQEVQLEQRAQTFKILTELDALESQVASRPVYQSAEEMLSAIQGQS